MAEVSATNLPFREAQDYFQAKVNLPTARWTDLKGAMHARAFTVAGAVRDELLADFRATVQQVVDGKLTLEAFRKDFDRIVETHGWSYKGGRGWRTKVIYEANLSTAYQAGRYKQMTDPDVVAYRPWWQYEHSDLVQHPREQHKALDGKVWRHDDPVWGKIFPPNGWGCKCRARALSNRQMKALGKTGADPAPDLPMVTRTVNTAAGKVPVEVPKGIDPGWDYNVGEAAWGRAEQAKRIVDDPAKVWEPLPGFVPQQPESLPPIPLDKPKASLRPPAPKGDTDALWANYRQAIDGDVATYRDPLGAGVAITPALVDHILARPKFRWDGRDAYWPLIAETVEDPAEIWLQFEQSKATGRVRLVRRYAKLFDLGSNVSLPVVAQAEAGFWTATTVFQSNTAYLKRMRQGQLVWRRDQGD